MHRMRWGHVSVLDESAWEDRNRQRAAVQNDEDEKTKSEGETAAQCDHFPHRIVQRRKERAPLQMKGERS